MSVRLSPNMHMYSVRYRCGVLVREETDQLFNHLEFLPLDTGGEGGAVGMNATECKGPAPTLNPPRTRTHALARISPCVVARASGARECTKKKGGTQSKHIGSE